MTSRGKRKLISCLGLCERGRPPLFTTARLSMSSVSAGSSLYSCGLITCASERARLEPKVRREAFLFTIVGLSHAEDVANRATRRVAHYDHATFEGAKTDDPPFTVVFALVFHLDGDAIEDQESVLEVEATFFKCLLSFRRIVG